MGAEYKQLIKLQKQIEDLQKFGIDNFAREVTNEVGQRFYAKVVKRTPVGKKPSMSKFLGGKPKTIKVTGASGKTKSFLSADAVNYHKYWDGYVGGNLRRNWTITRAKRYSNTYVVKVTNPTEYAPYVEFGHRQNVGRYVPQINKRLKQGWVEGRFMMTKTEYEIEKQMPSLVQRRLNEYLIKRFKV